MIPHSTHPAYLCKRALLEEEYGKTLLQIAQKQKASSTENGKTKVALDTMQVEFQSIAESHIQLSCHLRDGIATPLAKLINKQKAVRKEVSLSFCLSHTHILILTYSFRVPFKSCTIIDSFKFILCAG